MEIHSFIHSFIRYLFSEEIPTRSPLSCENILDLSARARYCISHSPSCNNNNCKNNNNNQFLVHIFVEMESMWAAVDDGSSSRATLDPLNRLYLGSELHYYYYLYVRWNGQAKCTLCERYFVFASLAVRFILCSFTFIHHSVYKLVCAVCCVYASQPPSRSACNIVQRHQINTCLLVVCRYACVTLVNGFQADEGELEKICSTTRRYKWTNILRQATSTTFLFIIISYIFVFCVCVCLCVEFSSGKSLVQHVAKMNTLWTLYAMTAMMKTGEKLFPSVWILLLEGAQADAMRTTMLKERKMEGSNDKIWAKTSKWKNY